MATLAKRIETILSQDDADASKEHFGDIEKNLARSVLILVSIPALIAPFLAQAYQKSFYWVILLLFIFLGSLFFIIQYRLHWILYLSHQLESLYHAA